MTDPAILADLLAPFGVTAFLSGHYGREPLLVTGNDSHRFERVIDWRELNRILDMNGCWDEGRLRLILAGRRLPPERYCLATGTQDRERRTSRPIPERVMSAVDAGATLVLNGLDGLVPAITELACGLEELLAVRVQSNLYLSKRGHPGLSLHFDPHDLFALQVYGRKRWRLYANRHPRPGVGAPPETEQRSIAGAVEREVTLSAGDLLYLPAGLFHEACAESERSLHLTIGLKHLCRLDLASLLIQRLAKDVDLTAPIHDLHEGGAALLRQAGALIAELSALASRPATGDELYGEMAANRRPRGHYSLAAGEAAAGPQEPDPGEV